MKRGTNPILALWTCRAIGQPQQSLDGFSAYGYAGQKWVKFREYYHNAELNAPRSADEHAQEIVNMVEVL